jgi:predicted AAA+ superfamily ATPase
MERLVENLVADFHARPLPELTTRDLTLPYIQNKVDAVVGMRRSGKTYFLYQQLHELQAKGIPRERTLYVNLEDERLGTVESKHLHLFPETVYRRYPKGREELCWFFFDEIQNVHSWERFVRRLLDTEQVRVVVSGSSSKLLGKEIATSMRGRSLTTELLPFSFREFLKHARITIPDEWPPPARVRSRLEKSIKDYIEVGGFPEVQALAPELRTRVHQEYVDVAVLRDIIERFHVSNTAALRHTLRQLLHAPARSFSVHRLFNGLKSQGLKVTKDAVHEFVRHFEDAFLLFAIEIDSDSPRVRMSRPRKCYLVDPGLARSFSFRQAGDMGWLLENTIYLELRRRGYKVNYLVTGQNREIDFIVRRHNAPTQLIQACADFDDPRARERETLAIEEALKEGRVRKATVVTIHQSDNIRIGRHKVRVMPAWEWLLRDSEEA